MADRGRTRIWVAAAAASVALLAAGCGTGGERSGSDSGKSVAAAEGPAYRGGQYCFPRREQQYRAGGYTCSSRHLRKLAR